jgi:L-threonylcarbamoyladenylate synthase
MTAHGHKQLNDTTAAYEQAARVLRGGGVAALPTDTVFGLVAVAADAAAVLRVYAIKGRDAGQPLPLFVAGVEQALTVGEGVPAFVLLAERFWPGPLTIVVPARADYASLAVAGGESVGMRAPDDARLRALCAELGPLTGTSANLSGSPECRTAGDVRRQLGEAVDLVVDAEATAAAPPSTVVDCTKPGLATILRHGGVALGAITEALAGVAVVE